MIDLHLHLLPGVDDGPSCTEESLEMCKIAAADGVTDLVAVPHVLGNFPRIEWKEIKKKAQKLEERVIEEGIRVRVHPGAELYFDERIFSLLGGKRMTLNESGRYLLMEFPFAWIPNNYPDFIFRIQSKGYRVILAHPERNGEILANPEICREILERGSLIQITAGSLTGLFGPKEAWLSKKMLKNGWVHFVGSDAHGTLGRLPLLSDAYRKVQQLLGKEAAERMFVTNPQKVLGGEEIG